MYGGISNFWKSRILKTWRGFRCVARIFFSECVRVTKIDSMSLSQSQVTTAAAESDLIILDLLEYDAVTTSLGMVFKLQMI